MEVDLHSQWLKSGYVVVRRIFDEKQTQKLQTISEKILEQWRTNNPEIGKPGGGPEATVMRHLNHWGYFDNSPQALCDLMDAVADERVLTVCREILGEESLFRCTSLFMNPLENSRDGNWHRDTQFHCPKEEDEKAMIQAGQASGRGIQMQIALVPSDEVEYVPSSHLRWDTPQEYQIRRADGGANSQSNAMPEALRIALQPGDAVAFNPYGLHRGRYHTNKLRRTLMFTYTRTSAPHYDYFSHQPWFLETGYMECLKPDARAFFQRFVEMYKTDWLKSRVAE